MLKRIQNTQPKSSPYFLLAALLIGTVAAGMVTQARVAPHSLGGIPLPFGRRRVGGAPNGLRHHRAAPASSDGTREGTHGGRGQTDRQGHARTCPLAPEADGHGHTDHRQI